MGWRRARYARSGIARCAVVPMTLTASKAVRQQFHRLVKLGVREEHGRPWRTQLRSYTGRSVSGAAQVFYQP